MLYTCTMNLAIDLVIKTQDLLPSVVNRSLEADYQPNGKGVNVSFIFKQLGLNSIAFGFSAGFTGRYIQESLEEAGIQHDFVQVEGINRINVFTRVLNQDCEYKLVNQGPQVHREHLYQLLEKVHQLTPQDTLIVSGSHPQGVDEEFYLALGQASVTQGFNLIWDISHPIILQLLPYHPCLIKPNEEELAHWFKQPQLPFDQLLTYGRQLLHLGAQQVLLSLGGQGAILLTPNESWHATAPVGKVVNTACAGDTLLATFIALQEQGISKQDALVKAVAAGSSTAFRIGLTDFSDVEQLRQSIQLIPL